MPLAAAIALFVVLTIGGALVKGWYGALCGAGAAFALWVKSGQLLDDLNEDRERRERGEPRFKPREVAFYAAVVLVTLLVALALNRAYESAGH